jgi:hypothetical protein
MEVKFNPYQITMPFNELEYELTIKWCELEFGPPASAYYQLGTDGKWIRTLTNIIDIYSFINEDDAMLFVLTWK